MEAIDKVYFSPGCIVTIKHDIPNKPIMLVKGKDTKTFRALGVDGKESTFFKGIKCFWFSVNGEYQEEVFSTKDLVHVNKAE